MMSPATGMDLDTRVLSEFIYALNIARRQVSAYPLGHPVIAAAAEKLLNLLPKLLEFRSEITIGIARDTLMVEGQVLPGSNPVYRDFATNLFDARVASLTLTNTVTADEICRFFEILRRQADQLIDLGGLDRVLASANIHGIQAMGVDYGAFHTTEVERIHAPKTKLAETETAVMWKSFVSGLVAGTLDPHGEKFAPDIQIDPQLLAEAMNRDFDEGDRSLVRNYDDAITAFLKETDRDQIRGHACQATLGRLGDLVSRLSPELRRRFLNSTLKTCAERQDVAADVLGRLPQTLILEAMDQVETTQLAIPQGVIDVMGKLAQSRGDGVSRSRVAGKVERSTAKTAELLGELFKVDEAEVYVPCDYQDALSMLAAAEITPGLDKLQLAEMVETLDSHQVEQQFCSVMLDLLDHGARGEAVEAISRNMTEQIRYFLDMGDFLALVSVYDHLRRHARRVESLLDTPDKNALRVFSEPEFVLQVIEGLDTWGKTKHPAIKGVIKRVGRPFAEPLLDCLADEPAMARRRLLLECLQLLGTAALDPIVARLHDRRWFFVRNLVTLLREMEDPCVLQPLGRLVGYAHPKVQFEVMRTFMHFQDPRADRYLLKELDSRDPEVLINVARLASKSAQPEVAVKLAGLLHVKLPPDTEANVKSAVIKSLAELALPQVLPELGRFLHSRSLFNAVQLTKLKVEAVMTLDRYSDPRAAELAEEVYTKYSGDLARAAGKVCLQLKGKLPWS